MNLLLSSSIELPGLFPVVGPFLNWIVENTGSVGIAIVIFTACLRLLTLPLDYISRSGMKKNSLKLERIKPQLEKLQKQYAHDKALLNQKMQALYKKENYSMFGSCLPMIVTMVLFFVVYGAFNDYLQYNIIDSYNRMQTAYLATGEDPIAWAAKAGEFKDQFMPSFLWIENIWLPDVFWQNSVMSATKFEQMAQAQVDAVMLYDPMVRPFAETSRVNGFFIMPVLAAGTALLSQWIMTKTQKTQMEVQGQNQTNKMMLIMMPLMMAFFAVQSHAAFSIYLVTSQIISIFTTLIINKIVEIRFRKIVKKEEELRKQQMLNR